MKDYSPLILIFNSLLQEKTLKRFIKYNKIMSFSNELKLTELIQIFKKHHWDEKYYNNSKIKIELPKKHFFSKNEDDSISFFKIPIFHIFLLAGFTHFFKDTNSSHSTHNIYIDTKQ